MGWKKKLSSMLFMFGIKFLNYSCEVAPVFTIKLLINYLLDWMLSFVHLNSATAFPATGKRKWLDARKFRM